MDRLIDFFSRYYNNGMFRDQQKTVSVDIIETFNYLLGLKVNKYKVVNKDDRRYVFVFGEKERQKTAIIWKSEEVHDNY